MSAASAGSNEAKQPSPKPASPCKPKRNAPASGFRRHSLQTKMLEPAVIKNGANATDARSSAGSLARTLRKMNPPDKTAADATHNKTSPHGPYRRSDQRANRE